MAEGSCIPQLVSDTIVLIFATYKEQQTKLLFDALPYNNSLPACDDSESTSQRSTGVIQAVSDFLTQKKATHNEEQTKLMFDALPFSNSPPTSAECEYTAHQSVGETSTETDCDEQTKLMFNALPFNNSPTPSEECESSAHQSVDQIRTKKATIPRIIVRLVCDSIRKDMGKTESYMGFPVPVVGERYVGPCSCSCHVVGQDSEETRLLKTMRVVSRAWATPALAALRRQIDIKCPYELEKLLHSSFCGAWVQEFQYVISMSTLRDIIGAAPSNTLHNLQLVLAQAQNLRALSIGLDNLDVADAEFSLTPFLSSISLSLQSLHIQLLVWTDETLGQLYDVVSNLNSLHTLSVIGYTFRTGASLFTSPWSVAPRKPPPASLKRLLLEFRSITISAVPRLSWLFTPRGGYSLHELKLRQNVTFNPCGVSDPLRALLPTLAPTLKNLKVLEVRLMRLAPGFLHELYCPAIFQCLMAGCTSLEELSAYVFDIPAFALDLPRSLRHLHVVRSLYSMESATSIDKKLVKILAPHLKWQRNLRSLNVSEFIDHNNEHGLFRTEELCKQFGVDILTTVDGAGCTWTRSRVV